ncbi:MAG: bifunctional diguanylate cyclase/phosphodiesterase [Ruminiclostridium sp.]|nr:bifunctional diguanylate cyclase/phosphodiesterase [Ruminiclostridium sp.]
MDNAKTEAYFSLFERLIDSMTAPDRFVREEFIGILSEICELFHIAKGVTEFYRSISAERTGDGEVLVDYDNGRGEKVVMFRRIVTPSMSVIKSTLYMAEEEEPLSEENYYRIDLILRAMLSFVSRNRLQNLVERFSFYDDDGYPNLNYFMRHLDKMNEKGGIPGNTAIHFNLRHFTLINREIGKQTGDIVMRRYFDQMSRLIGDKGVVCRVGGDNFTAIFRSELLQSVLFVTEGFPVVYDNERGKRVMVSASVGVFVIPDGFRYEKPAEIIGKIFPVGQEAKFSPDTNIVYYTEENDVRKERIMKVQSLFAEAMDNDEFRAYYQPKVDIETGRIVGAEALCRWVRDGKIIPPIEFIPVLEQSTDICRLDFRMLDLVCRDIRRRLDAGSPVVRVSVNLSRKHLIDVDLLEHLLKIIDDNRVPHEYIELELTETTTDVEFRDLKRIVGDLRREGIHTTVDDFGIGYSSLNLIREIPWDVLKLDRCFLPADSDAEDVNTALMFSHVVSMAQAMGLECVAEGVETHGHIELLKKNNCRIAQGFYFDRPLPSEEFERRLDSHGYDV